MAIFKKEKKKDESFMASAPEEDETAGEIKHIEELSGEGIETDIKTKEENNLNYREIPVCLSQTQINNLIIENNIMLKQLVSNED
jgi:hypothetical protein